MNIDLLKNHFDPRVKHDSDLAEGSCPSCIVTGVTLIVSSLTVPAIVSGNFLIRNNLSLMGMSFVTAGLTKKKGYVFLPAICALSLASYLKARAASSYIINFYKRDIKPLFTTQPTGDIS